MLSFIWSPHLSLSEKQDRLAVISTSINALFAFSFSTYFTFQSFHLNTFIIMKTLLFLNFAPVWWRLIFRSHFEIAKYVYLVFSFLAIYFVQIIMGPSGNVHLISLTLLADAVLFLGFRNPIRFLPWGMATIVAFILPIFEFRIPGLTSFDYLQGDPQPFRHAIEFVTMLSVLLKIAAMAVLMESERYKQSLSLQAAENNLQQKNSLLRVLFHDIQLPLAASLNGITALRKKLDPSRADATSLANVVESSQFAIKEIIENVSTINSDIKGFQLERKTHLLCELLRVAIVIVRSRIEEKKIELEFDSGNFNLNVFVDRDTFVHQVIGNLLSNAAKFTPPNGSIKIFGRVLTPHSFELEIRNHGDFPEAAIRGEQISTLGSWGEKGTGIGMKIARTFAELNTIKLQISNIDNFAVVKMELPLNA